MKVITVLEFDINGVIINNDDAWIYDWYEMEYTSPQKVKDFLASAEGAEVIININSSGGDLYSGVNIHDMIKAYAGNTEIHICGLAASAASIIAMAGKCYMSPASTLFVHDVACCENSNKSGKAKAAKDLAVLDRGVASVYAAKSGMSVDEALKLMDRETPIDAHTALEMKLIDGILGIETAPVYTNAAMPVLPRSVIEKTRQMLAGQKNTKQKNDGIPISRLERNLNLMRR